MFSRQNHTRNDLLNLKTNFVLLSVIILIIY